MTTAAEGCELTECGPGTPMGNLMRHYWIPALKSSELVADGDPIRLMLLGEKLVAFRDSQGRVGVMDHKCPHRCASLFLGRNEAGGIRCVYHGWKFDVTGQCVDMPSVAPHQDFKQKVRARAFPVREKAGVVWVYMGTRAMPPALPQFEILDMPEGEINVAFVQRNCNYLQALEGEIDTSHFGFLHAGHVDVDDVSEDEPLRNTIVNRAPEYHVADTPWGTQYGGYRSVGPGETYWRFANFLFPFWTQAPNGEFQSHMHARAWVPLDDHHTMFVFIWWKKAKAANSMPTPLLKDGTPIGGAGRANRLLPNTTDWLGRWRMADTEANDWGIDREAQRSNRIYTGIEGIHLQDQAITESMGPVTDFAFEHLAPSDQMITRTRRRLLMATRALRDKATPPPGADDASVYRGARSGYLTTCDQGAWEEVYAAELKAAVRPRAP
ncbi:MAG: Rieske 2Fe-2S domain-containing protein [Hyphomicrobiaceae bacterium]|nr:Rieske 2Fe-2S domain-containing protein [Hyphomicrobiaceae bacterium]